MPVESLELEDLLRSLQQEGAIVDRGSFSLDPSQAVEKLRRYQLAEPNGYLLKWVQAGVALGASCLRVQVSAARADILYEGISFKASELEQLFPKLLSSQVDPGLRALAVGLNSALGGSPHQIVLQSWDGDRGFEHRWRKTGPQQRPFQSASAVPASRLWLERKLSQTGRNWWSALRMPVLDGLFSKQATLGPEAALLMDSHCLLPAPLYLNGQLCQRPFGQPRGPQHHRLEVYFPGAQASLRCPVQTSASEARNFQPGQPVDCVIALTEDAQQAQRLWIVESGIILSTQPLPGRGAVVIACGRLFDKDLSDFKVIQNQRFQDFLELTRLRLSQLF
ncbi:hypothetical protein JST97_26705 [bacterium]|nr:hypothetical protein [bacterium]